jgi:diguanylate cyclase (GGDEF)-like protein
MGLRRRILATQIASLAIASGAAFAGHLLVQNQQQRILETMVVAAGTRQSGDEALQAQAETAGAPTPKRPDARTLRASLRETNRMANGFTLLGLGLALLFSALINGVVLAPLRRLENRMTHISSAAAPGDDPFEVSANAPEEVRSLATSYAALLDRIHILIARVEDLSLTDSLTLLGNRRQFQRSMEAEWRRMQRHSRSLSLLIVDLDHFKAYNLNHGHPEGDRTLVRVAAAIRGEGRRASDLSCRIGGEQFAVLLPETDQDKARSVGQRILEAVDALAIPHGDSPTSAHLTVSIGLASCQPGEDNQPEDLIAAAADALYRGKQDLGRHRLCAAREPVQLRNSLE